MRKWLVCLVLPALLLGACGGSDAPPADEDPLGALIAAFQETAESEQAALTFTIQSTPESLVAASAAEGGTPLSTEMADTILGSSLTVSGTKAEEPEDQSARVTVSVPGTEGAELLVVGQDFYVRADVRGLATAFGQDTAPIDAFLEGEAAAQYPFIESAVNGEFIHIEGAEQFTGGTTGTEELTAQQERVINEFTDAIREEAEVTFEGEDDVGDHFVVSAPLQALAERFSQIASELGAGTPTDVSDVPEGNLTFDVWVADGRVAQIEADVLRLAEEFGEEAPEGVEQFAIRLAFGYEIEEIAAPEDAVTVTAAEISGLFFGGAFGGGTETDTASPEPGTEATPPGGVEFDCSQYENLPPETFEGLPQETLDQLEQICPGIVPDQ